MSRWATFREWRKAIPPKICFSNLATCRSSGTSSLSRIICNSPPGALWIENSTYIHTLWNSASKMENATYNSKTRTISVFVSNTSCKDTRREQLAAASSTATSCRASALNSCARLLFLRNFAAHCLPLDLSRHLLTAAYLPLRKERKALKKNVVIYLVRGYIFTNVLKKHTQWNMKTQKNTKRRINSTRLKSAGRKINFFSKFHLTTNIL